MIDDMKRFRRIYQKQPPRDVLRKRCSENISIKLQTTLLKSHFDMGCKAILLKSHFGMIVLPYI